MHPCGTARTGSLCPLIVYLVNGSVPMNYSLGFFPNQHLLTGNKKNSLILASGHVRQGRNILRKD